MLYRFRPVFLFAFVLLLSFAAFSVVWAEDGAHGGTAAPEVEDKDVHQPGEAVRAPRKTERYTEAGVTIDPVAIDVAPNGDIYVAEGTRAGKAVLDNRNPPLSNSDGVIHDLQKTSVEDRAAQIQMIIDKGLDTAERFTGVSDRVRLVRDTTGDGKGDTSTIFADGFNDPLDGIASGVLFHKGKVYLTNIPHLWLLEDKDGDGDADEDTPGERISLSYGWGVRWTFYGHDLHGLIKGPDGRIYFSIGDRGYNVKTKEGKHLYGPDRGAVFRMWPDGSGLELFHEGLRNPQELAFDNYGNLFTGDNNSDSVGKARFVHLVEGGDSGWRQDVQSLDDRGAWNREQMWLPRPRNESGGYQEDVLQPAWIVPPIKNVGAGPSGLAHYPGTGDVFPANGSFLMCDYPRGVRHVHLAPDGAGFKAVEDSEFVKGGTITDVAWGYDGRLYLSDWGGGWKPNPNGYLKTMVNEAAHAQQAEQIAEVKRLFAEGFEGLGDEELIELLGHVDQRVRIHAQWEAAERKSDGISNGLISEWLAGKSEFSRLHALWALAMIEKENIGPYRGAIIYEYFEQPDAYDHPQLVAQAMSVLGDLGYVAGKIQFINGLRSEHIVEQYHAAIALGKTGTASNIAQLLDLLERNNNEDLSIRHAASYGLSLIGDAEVIHRESTGRGSAVRLGAVLALRRLDSPLLVEYLDDEDIQVAAEAVRAVYDKRVMEAYPALAALADTLPADRAIEPIMRRVIEANVRLADNDSAMRLARLAANTDVPEQWRLLALQELDAWADERNREGVWGAWWPRPEQGIEYAKAAMLVHLPGIAGQANEGVGTLARAMMLKHIGDVTAAELSAMVLSLDEPVDLRIGSLRLLEEKDAEKATEIARQLADAGGDSPKVRMAARLVLVDRDRQAGQLSYAAAIESGTLLEKQDAIARLGAGVQARSAISGEVFGRLADALKRDELDPALRLDVVEAVQNNQAMPAQVRLAVRQYVEQNRVSAEAPFVRSLSLAGGSVERGKAVFFHHEAASCTQCHRLDNDEAQGPNLSGISAVRDMDYLYTAVVLPNADVLEGYANELGRSNMKPMQAALSQRELRDVLAYLASLTENPGPAYAVAAGVGGDGGAAVTVPGVVAAVPSVAKPASEWDHRVLLPVVLLVVTGGLVVLLVATVWLEMLAKV